MEFTENEEHLDFDMIDESFCCGSDKENVVKKSDEYEATIKRKRCLRTTDAQFEKLFAYMQTHDDFSKGKASESQVIAFNTLVSELNVMGPPYRTGEEWRVVWSNRKGNQKRKLPKSANKSFDSIVKNNILKKKL